jgi:hypothetical protein
MELKDSERLIIFMLSEIMEAMNLNQEIDPSLIKTLITHGDDWAIKHTYPGIFPSESTDQETLKQTRDILWMWSLIEHGIANLQGAQAAEAATWHYSSFAGFDGNNDDHYGVAVTFIDVLGEFSDFKGRELNSHTQTTLPRYLRMYQKFDRYISAGQASPLGFDALKDLCN